MNPYNELGILHNEMLDYIGNANPTPTLDEFLTICSDFISNEYDDIRPVFRRYTKILAAQALNVNAFNESGVGYSIKDSILSQNKFNGLQLNFINQLIEPPADPIPVNHYEDIRDAILNSPLKPSEAALPLAMVGIAINSQAYWEDAKTNSSNPWYNDYAGIINVKDVLQRDMLAFVYAAIEYFVFSLVENGIQETLSEQGMNKVGTRAAYQSAMASGGYIIWLL
jgi:hypothetical protein